MNNLRKITAISLLVRSYVVGQCTREPWRTLLIEVLAFIDINLYLRRFDIV
jgi:hypothetical protein